MSLRITVTVTGSQSKPNFSIIRLHNGTWVRRMASPIDNRYMPALLVCLDRGDWRAAESYVQQGGASLFRAWINLNKHGLTFDLSDAACQIFLAMGKHTPTQGSTPAATKSGRGSAVMPAAAAAPTDLEPILKQCVTGDAVVCVQSHDGEFTAGGTYHVYTDMWGNNYITDNSGFDVYADDGDWCIATPSQAIIDGDNLAFDCQYHDDAADGIRHADSWDELATGGRVKADRSSEWTPDTINPNIDTSKKLTDW